MSVYELVTSLMETKIVNYAWVNTYTAIFVRVTAVITKPGCINTQLFDFQR